MFAPASVILAPAKAQLDAANILFDSNNGAQASFIVFSISFYILTMFNDGAFVLLNRLTVGLFIYETISCIFRRQSSKNVRSYSTSFKKLLIYAMSFLSLLYSSTCLSCSSLSKNSLRLVISLVLLFSPDSDVFPLLSFTASTIFYIDSSESFMPLAPMSLSLVQILPLIQSIVVFSDFIRKVSSSRRIVFTISSASFLLLLSDNVDEKPLSNASESTDRSFSLDDPTLSE